MAPINEGKLGDVGGDFRPSGTQIVLFGTQPSVFAIGLVAAAVAVLAHRSTTAGRIGDSVGVNGGVALAIAAIIGTGVVLALVRLNLDQLIYGTYLLLAWYAPIVLLLILSPSAIVLLAGVLASVVFPIALHRYSEWYVFDVVAAVWGVTALAALGLLLTPAAAVVILIVLAAYDAAAVFLTGHMFAIGETFDDLELPVFVYLPAPIDFEVGQLGTAVTVGLGDFVVPGLLVVVAAAGHSVTSPPMTAVGAAAGVVVGHFVAVALLSGNRPLPGLPVLNGGAITGYVVAAVAVNQPIV